MEGDGEGMVAIVQGLDPSGVTLTVCNRARHNWDRRRSSRTRIQINSVNTRLADMPASDHRSNTFPASSASLANQRSSVERSTGTNFAKQHTSSQICDGRYASSYKLAHCMVTPTSPPVAVSEFPPQRKEPCRNQGNFEIGGHGSGHSSGKVRVSSSRVRHYGGSQTWVEKGSSHRYCKSNRDTEAFAHSLRKYPSMAPFRTASTDLIEKLIRYTQAKNFQEMSRSSKSMRSLRQQKSSDTYEMARASKYQQTYTRRQDNNAVNNSNVQVGYRERARNFKLYSPMSHSRNLKENRHRETTFSSSYDYLKAGRNRSDETPSPVGSSSPERTRSPERSRSPDKLKNPEVSRSPVRFKSIDGLENADGFRSPNRPNRADRPIPFERSVRDLSLSDMSKYIRSTIRQICNERQVVFQVCPKLKNRYNEHKKVCPNKKDRAIDIMEDEPDEDQYQESGSVLSRLIQSFSRCAIPSTEQTGCQCTRTDCYCTKATQCVNNPDASTNTHSACSCKIPTKIGCCRGMHCVCASKSQDQAYYNKRIDEEIAEWLKDVPVNSIEGSDNKKKRDTVIKELRKTLKQLADDENYDENARNEIKSFIDDFPMWNPGKDRKDEKLFKNQLADKLTERILSVPRKPDRFRDIIKKWVANMDFEEDGEEVDKDTIIDKFVNKLKSMAVDRPACDVKYTHTLRKEIIELLVELALKFDGDMIMLKKMANKLATEIVSIPRNVNLCDDTTDLTDEFEENVSDWICEHGLCGELKKDPKLIEGLARKLNKLKCQGIDDECVAEKMKEEIHQFVDDVGIAIETIDELIDELMKQLSNTVQTNEMEKLDQDELTEVFTDWLSNLPGASDLHPRKFEKIIKELVKVIIESREHGNENLANDILTYLVDADLGIDPADLGIHVEELMEKLNLLPSNKYHKDQIKKEMVKDIFDIIENLSVSQDKKKKLRNKAYEIVENHLLRLSLNSKEAHDDMKYAIMEDMDDAISGIDIPRESRLKLKASLGDVLNSNFDKSFMRLKRLSREGSDLKQTITKDVRNAVKELSIDTDKKKDLMQQVKGTLSKNMHKPLPSNVTNTINGEISDIVERCPISEDNSVLGSLKKLLLAVASKHLNICVPKCVCDIHGQVEKDVEIVIDRSSIDTAKKKELKKSIQNILTENEDRQLSDEVLKSIKEDISGVVSDLSIPQDRKDVLKKTVGETISKDFNEALSKLRHDLNKIRNKLFDDICNIIEKSPIPREVKTHLKNKLKSVLARNLDSSLSDEEKYTILDDVSNIVKDDMPEEKRRSLTNKLAKKLGKQQGKEYTNETDKLTKNLKELENKILEYTLRETEQAIEEAPIPREKKNELKIKLKDISTVDYKKPAEDIAEALISGTNEILDELNLPMDKKKELKIELASAIDEYSKLRKELKDVGPEYIELKRRSSIDANGKHKGIGNGLMPMGEFDETKAKKSILQGIEDIIEESSIAEEKKMELKRKLKKMAADHFNKPLSDDVLDAIKSGITDMLDELQIPKPEKDKLKRALVNMADEIGAHLQDGDKTIAKESILQGIEKIIKESAVSEEKKTELKRKLKKMATDNLKKPFSDDVRDAIKIGITDILDELQAPAPEKNKLKRALMDMTKDYLDKLREEKRPLEKVDEKKAKESILQGIEDIIEESSIAEEKKMELKRKLKKMTADHFKKPLSDDVLDAIKSGITDMLDELQIPKPEKDKLKRALVNMADKIGANLQDGDKTIAKESILQGIEKIIKESAVSEEKKMELKRKLKKMATDNLKEPFSDDVRDAIKIGITDILDELQAPAPEKNKLKRALMDMTKDYLDKLREEKRPLEKVDEKKAKESILQGIEDIIEESSIAEEKKMELKRKLKKMAADHLKKPLSDDVLDAIKSGIPDMLEELQIPKPEKDKLKRALVNMADEIGANLQDGDKTKAKESILQGIEKIIKESAVPEEKKMELKRKLKKMATDNLKEPFSDDVRDAIKVGITDILDELQAPGPEKNKLKRALMDMTKDYLNNLREEKRPLEKDDEKKAKESILQGIEDIIEELSIAEEKKMELKRKLKKMAADHLKKPLSDDVLDAIKSGISDMLDELQLPKPETLVNMADEIGANLQDGDKTKAKESILQGIGKIIKDSAVPEEKKMELKRKLKKMATDNLKKPFSDDVRDAIKIGITDILDELQAPAPEKNKLKRALMDMTKDYLDNLREEKRPLEKDDEKKAKESILQGIENIIEESSIAEDKKNELKRKLKKMAADHLKKPLSDDVLDAIKSGIPDMLEELQIPKPEKDKLKRALVNMADEIRANLQDGDKTKAKESILQGIGKIIKDSAVPEEKKMELKRKLKKMATDNLKKPFSDDVRDAIKIGITDILDELQAPAPEKNKLKRALMDMTKEYLDNLREEKRPLEKVDEKKAKESILQDIEDIIEESSIAQEKKMELKRKLKKMAADHLKKPLSDDVLDAIKSGITDMLDELQIPKPEKDKLKRALVNMADEIGANLQDGDKTKAKESILQGIEKIIKESAVPEEKKMALKQKLKKMATDNLKKPFSDDVRDAIKIGITDILDELQAPAPEKNKLKRALMDMTKEYLDNLREEKRPLEKVDEKKAKESILQGIADIIEESSIAEEKKNELKRKLKKMAADHLKKPLSDDVLDAIKSGISDMLDELQIPKPETLVNMADEIGANLQDGDKTKAKESILQGIGKIIKDSAVPEEKKMELKRKLKKMATNNLKKPFSDDVRDAIKIGITDILDELQAPTPEKNKLKHALMDMTKEHLDNLREEKRPLEKVDEKKAKESILQDIEDIIEESSIAQEKKMELKRKLKKMAADHLKKPLSDDVLDAIKSGITDMLDELQIPKPEKDKLKRALVNMADEIGANLQDGDKTKAKESILQGIEKIIKESAVPEEKKMALKQKLKKMATDNLKKPFSDDVRDAIKIGITDILDELQAPAPERNKLKRALMDMTKEYLDNLREEKRPLEKVDEKKAKESILQDIEDIIEESSIAEEKKMELKRKLKKMAADHLKKPLSDDVLDAIKSGITDMLDELHIPKPEKDKLKRALVNMADEIGANLQDGDKTKAKESILQGIEKIIKESAVPEEKKMELKRKLKNMATDNLKKPFSDDVRDAIKIDITDILDELQIPTPDKNKLKRALMNMTKENVANLRDLDKAKVKESILQGIERIIKESVIPEEKKMELKRKLKKMATANLQKPFSDDVEDAMKIGIADILDELQVPSFEKNKLKRALLNMVDENIDSIQRVPLKLSSQAFKELENDTQNNILHGFEKAIDEAPIPIDKKKELKKKLKDAATKNFQKLLFDDTAEALKDNIDEILDELNLPKDNKNKLKSEVTAAVDENLSNLKNEIDLAKSMPDAKRNKLNITIRRVLPQFDEAVDPSHQKQLAEEFDELLEIALTGGDFNDARRKLIKKLMREQNLSEKEASAPVDELIDRAQEMALNEEKYELDPSYVKTLEADINDLVGIALVGGDFKDTRRKLTKKLMREQKLPEEEASVCADDLIAKAQKLALAAQAKDKSLLHKEAFAKAVSDAVDQSTMSKPDKNDLKNKLLRKLKQHMDKKTYINKDDLEPLKTEVLNYLKKDIDESSIPTAKKNELISLLNKDLAETVDEIIDHYDDEEGYTKDYTKALSKVVNKAPMRNLDKTYLKKELAKTFEGIMNDPDVEKKTKHKEAFTNAINDAVDQSTLSKTDKKSLKNKLINKMEETVDESPNINDTGALKAEVLKDCKNLVDVSSIPMGQKNELKILLKEEIMDDYDNEEMEESPEYDDKVSEYKEAFAKATNEAISKSPDMDDYDEKAMEDKLKKYKETFARAINHAVDQSTLSKLDKNNIKNKLLSKLNETINNSPNLNDIGALTAEVLNDSKNVIDVSSLPTDKKKELKLLLQQAMEDASKELMDDEEISGEAFAMFKDKIAETVKTWMDKLPIDLDPEVATAVANDIASDILDRQKYLQVHPEAASSDKDEIENLKYQIFRRMKYLVDPKDIPPIMDGTEDLYRMLMELEPPPGFPKFGLRGLVDYN